MWGDIIVEELVRCGVGVFCLSPGSRSTPLALAVANNTDAHEAIHFDERGMAYYALGCAKASGRPSVLICTSGTAAANYLPAVVEASQSRVPLIVITADRPPELLECGANQAVDQTRLFGNYARWYCALPCPDESVPPQFVLTSIDQALHRATASPAGPVHINCMFREPFFAESAEADAKDYLKPVKKWQKEGGPYTRYIETQQQLPLKTQAGIVEVIRAAKRGLLVVGELRSEAECVAVKTLARALKWPVFPDVASGLRLGAEHQSIIPYFDQILLSPPSPGPDTVLQIGAPVTSKRLLQYLSAEPPARHLFVADHPLRHDPRHDVTMRIQYSIECLCEDVAARLKDRPASPWLESLVAQNRIVNEAVETFLSAQKTLCEPYVARCVSRLTPVDSLLFLGNSMPIRDMDMYAAQDGAPLSVAVNRGASGIDGNVATALGHVHGRCTPATVLLGDLALLHDLNSLALLRTFHMPVVFVVINNDGGGIFSFLPVSKVHEHFESHFATPHGMSFEHAAAQFGLQYAAPKSPSAFTKAYVTALNQPRHTLIEVRTKRDANVHLHHELQGAIRKRLEESTSR